MQTNFYRFIVLFLALGQFKGMFMPLARAQLQADEVVFNTSVQPPSGFQVLRTYSGIAQRFTTDDSTNLTLRRIEFDLMNLETPTDPSGSPITIAIHQDDAGFPGTSIGVTTTPLFSNSGHYKAYGNFQLQPLKAYWVFFRIFDFGGLSFNSFAMNFNPPNAGTGSWFGPNDDKSAYWSADTFWPNNFAPDYGPAIQITLSTVPEPTTVALSCMGLALHAVRSRLKQSHQR